MKAPLSTFLGIVGLVLIPSPTARAQVPTGGQVVAGAATIAQSGSAMTITQASRHAIVNWQSFNLGADATLRLQQSGADAAMLARVTGGDPSKLLGTLKADGKLFLINPKGVLVGEGAVIDTAAFLASTLDVSDADFLRGGALTFKGGSAAGILNLGTITAREGNVLLLAHTVKNTGSITAPNGTAGLAAGSEIYLASPDAPDFVIQASLPESGADARPKTGVDNSGVIAAAQARLEAAGGSLYELAINQNGIVRATGAATVNGRVLLTAAGGTIGVSGQVSARNANGAGGEILVGGDAHGGNPAIANATHTVITTTGVLDASAVTPSAAAGRVIVWSDQATRFLGSLRASGAGGGFAEVSGRHGLDFRPASAVQLGAGGTLLLDPDALVVSTGVTSGTTGSGSDPFTFGASTEPATLNVATLQDQLATTNVILDTSASTGDITFASPVAWTSDRALTVRSGNNINLNASLTGGAASTLVLSPGRRADAPPESGLPDIQGEVQLASDATVTVGTLRYGANAASSPGPGYTMTTPAAAGVFFAHGNLHVDALEVDLSAGEAGVVADGSDNAIGAFRTTGTGTLSSAYVVDHHGGLDVTLNSSTAGGPYLQFITPGTLALKAGSQLDFASSGTVLLASTSGAFVNEAGAAVFGDHARFLIYSSTTSATTKGGLSGTEVFSHPFSASDDYSSDTISRFFYTAASGAPILTYTASDLTRTYGAANPALTYTTTGWLDGVTNDVTGSPALSTTATQNSGVGAYTINIGAGSLASSNYDFAFVPGTLTIERAPLTITATDATRRVNRANPAFGATYAGFVLGQDASALSGTLSITTPATTASPVGHYAITPTDLTSSNYAITFVPGTLAVTATASLLITADDVSRTYGAANPTFTATYHGLVEGDDASVVTGLQFSTTATQSSGVGTYAITPFGASATGYDINYASGTLTITRAPLTISIPNQSRLYGDPNDFTVAFNGLVNDDTSAVVTGLSLTSPATPSSSVGTYPINAAGATAANYSISYAPGALSILPAPLVVNIGNATRVYGEADPAFTYTIAGLKNGDRADGAVSVTGLSSVAAAEAGVGAYGIVGFASAVSPNYSVTTKPGTLTIAPRPITIVAEDKTRIYGDANPAFTATFTGLAAFDTPAIFGPLSFSTQATTASGAGAWGITFSPVRNPNYAVTPVFGTLTIRPAPLALGALDDVSRLYGRADPLLTLPTVAGLRNDDTVAGLGLTFSGVPAPTADVGSYTYTVAATNPNYTFTAPTATFRIDPAPLTVAITPTGRLYGEANPSTYEFTANGLAFGQAANSVLSIQNPTGTGTAVGTYALTPVLNTRNYYVSAVTGGDFKINPRVLTLDLPYYARYYGDANPAFFIGDILVGGDGLAAFDTITSLVPELHTAAPTDAQSNTGYYRIDPTFSANPNYRYSWTPGYLAVMPRPVEVRVGNGVSFGGNNVPPDFNPATLDAELITFDAAHPQGTGYRIEISNLPAFASPADLAAHIGIAHSDANTPQTVGVAVPLNQVPFPARPDRTKPVAATDPIPDDQLGIITIPLTQVMPTSPTTTSPLDVLTGSVIFSGGTFIVDPTGTKTDERFADLIRYLLPQPSLGGNYVVTAIHNGKLTMKSDPVVVQHTLDAEAIVAKRRAAEESFLTGTTGGLSIKSTFGLTPDEFPLIREAFVNMLFDLTRTDPTNDFLRILAGNANKVTDINQVSNDAILFWLADIHTNPAKQALLAPAMASYGVKIAGLSPSQRTPLQQKLVNQMTPYLAEARGQFIDDVQAARQAWVEVQTGNTNLTTLTGAEIPYEKFIQSGVEKTVSKAFNGLQTQSGALTETDAMHMLGLASGTLVGVGAGAIAAQTVAANLSSIFPKMGAGLTIFAERAGQVAADVSEAITGFEASSGVFAVVSTAVTIGITKAIAVGEEEKQRQNFETLLASRNGPIDAHAMSETEQGHAILTLGLLKMFGGG